MPSCETSNVHPAWHLPLKMPLKHDLLHGVVVSRMMTAWENVAQ